MTADDKQMILNNKTVPERGLQRTIDFFNSSAFEKFHEKIKREDKYGHIKPGLTEHEIGELIKFCNDRFGCSPPQGWITLLRIMNGFYSRINGFEPADEDSSFIYNNTYNLENEYFCDDNRKLVNLMIGWEDESYYGYNMLTGKYADLSNLAHDEYKIFHSFSDLFIEHLSINGWYDEIKEYFQEYLEYTKKEDELYQHEHLKKGDQYYNGEDVEQDYTKAVYHYREAAERDTPESKSAADAQYKLGLCYAKGHGIEKDDFMAAYWYWRASKIGHAKAERAYALTYLTGKGQINKNIFKAIYWFILSVLTKLGE